MIDLRHVRSISKLEASQPYAFCVTTDDRNLIVRSSGCTETNNWIKTLHIHADIARGGSGMNIVSDFNEAPLSNGSRKASRSRSCLTLQQELDLNLHKLQELELELSLSSSGPHQPDPNSSSSPNRTLAAGGGVHLEAKSLSDHHHHHHPDRQQQQSVVETIGASLTSSTEKRRGGTLRSRCIVDAAQTMEHNPSFDSDDDAMEDRCVVQLSRPSPRRALSGMSRSYAGGPSLLFKGIHPSSSSERSSREEGGRDKQPQQQQHRQEGGASSRASEVLHLDDVSEELDSPIPGQGRVSRRTERTPSSSSSLMRRGVRHPNPSVDAYADSSDDFAYIADVAEDHSVTSLSMQRGPQLREEGRSQPKVIRTHHPDHPAGGGGGQPRIKAAWGAM